jgi:dephospho-CoA kinase
VHALYDVGGKAVGPIEAAFPGVAKDGRIDRQELAKRVLDNPAALQLLESIIHPLVGELQVDFLNRARADGAPIVVLDIPLLFEKGGNKRVEAVVVVSAPKEVQRKRVLERPGMTVEKFEAILAKQTPDEVKRANADFVVETDKGLDHAFEQVKAIVAALKRRAEKAQNAPKR